MHYTCIIHALYMHLLHAVRHGTDLAKHYPREVSTCLAIIFGGLPAGYPGSIAQLKIPFVSGSLSSIAIIAINIYS